MHSPAKTADVKVPRVRISFPLLKVITMSRTFKKAYTKSKRIDKSCRNHGSCSYCEGNRLHKHRKQPTVEQELKQIGI